LLKKLTEEIVTEAIKGYVIDHGYWLKPHQLAYAINISVLNRLVKRITT
jgi:hypothetical protein